MHDSEQSLPPDTIAAISGASERQDKGQQGKSAFSTFLDSLDLPHTFERQADGMHYFVQVPAEHWEQSATGNFLNDSNLSDFHIEKVRPILAQASTWKDKKIRLIPHPEQGIVEMVISKKSPFE